MAAKAKAKTPAKKKKAATKAKTEAKTSAKKSAAKKKAAAAVDSQFRNFTPYEPKKNEIYIDVIEKINLLLSKEGQKLSEDCVARIGPSHSTQSIHKAGVGPRPVRFLAAL